MSEFKYTFQYNSTDGLIVLDFLNKKIQVFEDPWGRDSSSTPDHVIAFIDVKKDNVLTSKFKNALLPQVVNEILFLADYHSSISEIPNGDRSFYFRSSASYFKQKEKSNLIIGLVFLVLSITALFPLFFFEQTASKPNSIYLFISLMCFTFFSILIAIYIKRVRANGFNVLGTEYGIYVYLNNNIKSYTWNSFTGKYEIIKSEKGFCYELKEIQSVYNKYGSNKVNKHLNFVGIDDFEFFVTSINYKISTKST